MKKVLFGVATLIVVAAVGLGVWLYPVFKVTQVIVTGNVATTQEEIDSSVGDLYDQNLLRVDTTEAAQRVTALPWVAETSVAKKFPSTVEITLVEHEAVLFTARDDGDHLIDAQGDVFVIETHPDTAIAVTNTPDDDAAVFRDVINVLTVLGPQERAAVAEVRVLDAAAFELVLTDGRIVYWGASENNNDKAVAFGVALTRPEQNLDISGAPVVAVR